jgi:glycosyltransferase involved in cell wall biosynthesis
MRLLSRDNRVLWVNSIGYRTPSVSKRDLGRVVTKLKAATHSLREVEPNLFVLNPLVVPLYSNPAVAAFNRRWLRHQVQRAMARLRFRRPINWVFNPAAALIAGELGEDELIYHCVDEYTAFSGVHSTALAASERRLLEIADFVIVSSHKLYAAKAKINPRCALVRHGVDFHHFRKALDPATPVPDDIGHLPRPVIGYFGLIAQDWIDLPLLMDVANAFPNSSLAMLGKSTMDLSPLTKLPNVHLLGRKPYDSLPNYCKAFDVAIIPFPINEATLNSNPLKAREYLAAGLPVVSTAIPEVRVLNQCRVAETHEQFINGIRAALSDPGSKAARSNSVRDQGWDARLDEIREHLARFHQS